jgi:hypothetical protein
MFGEIRGDGAHIVVGVQVAGVANAMHVGDDAGIVGVR